ncbi:MAG: tRNA pseudouridine(38-40) synthase TruA [Candidatus Lokiarchaeota archaeon]|nr:tRNA pseudouridine(38-40) synthase TruA [Candidatus Lokiarchaeota archaeon]
MFTERKFFFKFYYIGGYKFHGSQRQGSIPSIEKSLIDVLIEKNYINEVRSSEFQSASRTDRYVSARGAVFSLKTKKKPILMEINSSLPKEIGLWAYTPVPDNYSPRFNAILRYYKYIVPYPYSYLKRMYNIDLDLMKKACDIIKGTHNFQNFSKKSNEFIKNIREMKYVSLEFENDVLTMDFKSQGFLRQQIRRIVKKILELGMGEITLNDFKKLFDTSKNISYQPADPNGLILWDIEYDSNVHFIVDEKSLKRLHQFFHNQMYDYWIRYNLFNIMQKYDFS